MNKQRDKRVLVGMSGGIDSSATCIMLQEQGYEVVGVTMRTWDVAAQFSSPEQEEPNYILEARQLAQKLGIEHHVADVREEFKQVIVKYFIDEYLKGRTPNPCVMCNPLFKERLLCEWADKTDCAWISTGHYCRLEERADKLYIVAGDDITKDQSYFLWRLPQEILQRFLFPLGNYTKQEVREYLKEKGYEAKAQGGESMEVCFIEGDYRDFLRQEIPDLDTKIGPGFFVDNKGVKIGQHKGFPYYTIGQRKGLGIALGHPAHVLRINAEKNTVMLGTAEDLKAEYMLVEDALITNMQELLECPQLCVRIRYRSKPIPCQVLPLDNGQMLVRFLGEASAIAPGQSAVFYDGQRVLGGAFIASQRGIFKVIADHPF
ncbi:MAG: tRNA 2-thiouridine(34) synthase MnmA [Bacteroidaceae bacterium]|nr:tRNA 2-thiouridine(34) synthase MnmA [Bacteroidaceae bacterium]